MDIYLFNYLISITMIIKALLNIIIIWNIIQKSTIDLNYLFSFLIWINLYTCYILYINFIYFFLYIERNIIQRDRTRTIIINEVTNHWNWSSNEGSFQVNVACTFLVAIRNNLSTSKIVNQRSPTKFQTVSDKTVEHDLSGVDLRKVWSVGYG